MTTTYFLYHLPTGRHTLEEELGHKQIIGTLTFEGGAQVFTWATHPGQFMFNLAFHAKQYGVIDEYGNRFMLVSWIYNELSHVDVMHYDRSEVPEDVRV